MNQYFLLDLSLRKGYSKRKPALKRLLKIVFPSCDENTIWDKPYSCDEVNDAIDKVFKGIFKKNTPKLCLDYFVELFGDGSFTSDQTTIMQAIHEVVKHKDIIYRNIELRCKE